MDDPRRYRLSAYEVQQIVSALDLYADRFDSQPRRERITRLRRLIAGVQSVEFTPWQRAAATQSATRTRS